MKITILKNIYFCFQVPTSVSHLEFWRRYFYRVHLLRKAEAKRIELIRKAEMMSISDIDWEKGKYALHMISFVIMKYSNNFYCTFFSSFLDEKLNDVHSRISGKRAENSGVKHVIAEINFQNSDATNLSPNASKKALYIPDETTAITKTDSNRNNTLDNSCIIDSRVDRVDNALASAVNETSDFQNVSSASDSNDESRSSPVESLGKG